MGKIILYTLVGLLVIALGVAVISCSLNPLRQSEERIRGNILELTPIGMNVDDALEAIGQNEKWGNYRRSDRGYIIRYGRPILPTHNHLYDENEVIGVETIRVLLGTYRFGLGWIFVSAYWAFDENSSLVDVIVWKEFSGF